MNLKKSSAFLTSTALGCFFFAACDNGSSPATSQVDKAAVKADLELLASKAKKFSAPTASSPDNTAMKRSALAKKGGMDCENGLTTYEDMDSLSEDGPSFMSDSTWNYDATNTLSCENDLLNTHQKVHGYYRNPMYETWSKMDVVFKMDTALASLSFDVTARATGRVHYFSGYDFTIDSMVMIIVNSETTQYQCDLGLQDGRYQVPLKLQPGVDLNSEVEPEPTAMVLRGPILFKTETVGYFEVMGDDSIIIRDVAGTVVESHK
jgi:hypothetical protein